MGSGFCMLILLFSLNDCNTYLQGQRQICMMDSQPQQAAISAQLMKLGLRG